MSLGRYHNMVLLNLNWTRFQSRGFWKLLLVDLFNGGSSIGNPFFTDGGRVDGVGGKWRIDLY